MPMKRESLYQQASAVIQISPEFRGDYQVKGYRGKALSFVAYTQSKKEADKIKNLFLNFSALEMDGK